MHEADLYIFLKILVIIVLAGSIGWERESAGKAAGLRTHILVGVSSMLFVVIGEIFIQRFSEVGEQMRFDPVRIVEAVVTGISFLGAGMIFARGKDNVSGLTTAASILATAAIGMIVGLERYVLAVGATIIVFIVLHLVNIIERERSDSDGETQT